MNRTETAAAAITKGERGDLYRLIGQRDKS